MNLETVNTYEGTHDIHGLILGRAITGYQVRGRARLSYPTPNYHTCEPNVAVFVALPPTIRPLHLCTHSAESASRLCGV